MEAKEREYVTLSVVALKGDAKPTWPVATIHDGSSRARNKPCPLPANTAVIGSMPMKMT